MTYRIRPKGDKFWIVERRVWWLPIWRNERLHFANERSAERYIEEEITREAAWHERKRLAANRAAASPPRVYP